MIFFPFFKNNLVFEYFWSTRKPLFLMDKRPLIKGCIANFGIFLDFLSFCNLDDFFRLKKKNGFWGILGPPYCGFRATIRIGREMLCLLNAGFF